MVNTRSQLKKKEMDGQFEHKQAFSEPTAGCNFDAKRKFDFIKMQDVAGTSLKRETPPQPPASSVRSKSTSSSVLARRKQLELEAAREKAKIQMELIDKKLEADLAELEDEKCSPHMEERTCNDGEVEKWLERSQAELEQAQPAPDYGVSTGDVCPLASNNAGTSDGTVQMLAAALRDMAASSRRVPTDKETNLLSRICTPRDLPIFTGDPMDWLLFRQAYEESTQVCKFSPRESLWRLRKCLRGPAKDAVASLLITAATPDAIMSTLQLRFGNPDLIISKMTQDVRKVQPVSTEYHKDIVPFSVKIQNYVAAIQAVGRGEYLQDMNLVSTILSKLPPVLISKWSDYSFPLIPGTKSRLEIMADFLREEATKISATANAFVMGQRGEYLFNKHKQQDSVSSRSQTVLVQTDRSDKCLYCSLGNHKLTECKRFNKALRKDRWRHVKRFGLCYKCLLSRHDRETCPAPACDKDDCRQPHHRLLHFVVNKDGRDARAGGSHQVTSESAAPEPAPSETVMHMNVSSSTVLLKVLPLKIHGPNGIIETCALLDDASTVTLVSARLAERAGLRGREQTMRMRGAWNTTEIVCKSSVVNVDISGLDNKIYTIKAQSVNELNLPAQNVSVIDLNKYSNLKDLKNELCLSNLKPQMLIGQDNYHLLLTLETRLGKLNEPAATRTPLGWCIHGVVASTPAAARKSHSTFLAYQLDDVMKVDVETSLKDLHELVQGSFSLESMGVAGKPRENRENVRAYSKLEETAKLINGEWHVGLPWRDESCIMVDSYQHALSRLRNVERKMSNSESYAQRYLDRINHLFDNNYAEEVKSVDSQTPTRVWYLPHFGVDNPNKKKLRLVFDAAAKSDGLCLNDYLLQGPDLLSSLLGIMMRFREFEIGVTGDIKDMFLRVKIRSEDQDAFRFLWRNNSKESVKVYKMTSLIFGANCSPFIAQFIKNKNAQQYESSMPDAVTAICKQHYVDDYIDSFPDENYGIDMVRNVTKIHKAGGFEIRNWTCNNLAVLDSVPKETLGEAAIKFKIEQQYEGERTLGLIWYPSEDALSFDVSLKQLPEELVQGKQRPTKRLLLKVIMSIFDVFGFLSPFIVQGRMMLQETWCAKLGWDDFIPDEIFMKWCRWLVLLKTIGKLRIPRWHLSPMRGSERDPCETATAMQPTRYETATTHQPATTPTVSTAICDFPPRRSRHPNACAIPCTTNSYRSANSSTTKPVGYRNLQLHVFSDSSTKAMCAVAYWRWLDKNSEIRLSFIASKCKVAPVKPSSVPRLELVASLLAARLADTIGKEHRIKAEKRFFWCDSSAVLHWISNDARNYKAFIANQLGEIDELTRMDEWRYVPTKMNVADCATREVFDSTIFETEWLRGPSFLYSDESCWPRNLPDLPHHDIYIERVAIIQDLPVSLPVPDPERFSSWLRLLRATAAVLKFINKCKKVTETDASMMEHAERLLMRQAQLDSFLNELTALKNNKCIDKSSKLLTLTPVIDDDGLLRVGGRIDAAFGICPEMKNPIILDGRHHISKLIVKHYHVKAAHGNQETVVNNLKQKLWIIRLRPTVKYVATRCMVCRIRKAKPEVPRMGNLPEARVAHHQRPFSHCGADLFGPMEVTIGRRREKRYGVLFTCLIVRAIHLEIVHSLTSDSLIMALRRVAARRGWPQYLYSDNGTNLRGADNELKKSIQELDNEVLQNEAMNNGAHWTFIPPASPHWGGAWERLIRSVKSALKVVMKERAPREEVLSTLFAEVENIVNSRPLTHVSVEPGSDEALTPNHFLLGSSGNLPALGVFDSSDLYLRKQWRKAQYIADMFWKRWVKEALPELLPRTKWTREQVPLQVGDLVLIVDPDAPRNVWPRGVIQQVFPGRDGRVRLVEVKTKTGLLKRSAARVARIPIVDECCASTGVGRVGDAL